MTQLLKEDHDQQINKHLTNYADSNQQITGRIVHQQRGQQPLRLNSDTRKQQRQELYKQREQQANRKCNRVKNEGVLR